MIEDVHEIFSEKCEEGSIRYIFFYFNLNCLITFYVNEFDLAVDLATCIRAI